jgi:ribonuclease J
VPTDRVILARDGVTVDLAGGVATITGKVQAGLVYVDGQTVGRATEDTLKERRLLREGGIITVLALVDPTTNRLAEPLEFLTRGFVHDDHTFDGASTEVEKALDRAAGEKIQDVERLEQLIAGAVSRYIQRTYRREPVVIAIVVDA